MYNYEETIIVRNDPTLQKQLQKQLQQIIATNNGIKITTTQSNTLTQ